jgi:hypothetical protein
LTRDREFIEKLIKSWAQDHHSGFVIAELDPTQEALDKTGGHLTWVIREKHANIDLLALADRLEVFLENKKRRLAGMHCKKCMVFYDYAEPNQADGSMICYSCRNPCG